MVERVWTFNDETVYSLLWQGGSLWVGTGLEGKLYRFADGQMILVKDVDERQIVALLPPPAKAHETGGGGGPVFATTNGGALYRLTAGHEEKGTYTSAPLDAGQVSRFGAFHWRGEAPRGSSVHLSFRSGVSAVPGVSRSIPSAVRISAAHASSCSSRTNAPTPRAPAPRTPRIASGRARACAS